MFANYEKVAEFIDGLSISEMDKHELKSLVLDLEQGISVRTYRRAYDKGDSDGRYYERKKVIAQYTYFCEKYHRNFDKECAEDIENDFKKWLEGSK